jgi:uncharacterized protein
MSEVADEIAAEVHEILGSLPALPLYVVRSSNTAKGLPPMAITLEHLRFAQDLERRGVLVMLGPFLPADGSDLGFPEEGMEPPPIDSLAILRAASLEEATAIVEKDPVHREGYRVFKIEPWRLDFGCLTTRLHISDGSFKFD